jgi:hypothetical protein
VFSKTYNGFLKKSLPNQAACFSRHFQCSFTQKPFCMAYHLTPDPRERSFEDEMDTMNTDNLFADVADTAEDTGNEPDEERYYDDDL